MKLYTHLKGDNLFVENGGPIGQLFFAGLPDTCEMVKGKTDGAVTVFPGNETPMESLDRLGIPQELMPNALDQNNPYDWGDFEELKSYLPNEKLTINGFYDGREGAIGLYPVPSDVRKIDVYYLKKPKMVTKLDDYIELDDNYIDLVKYNVMSIIAMSGHNPDIELANEYILLYNNLVQRANENKNEQQQRYPIIRDLHRNIRTRRGY